MEKIVTRVASRYKEALGIGHSAFTDNMKLHRYAESLRVTDMTNAGKRGKKVLEMTITVDTFKRDEADGVLNKVTAAILKANDYVAAKHAVEKLRAEDELIEIHEVTLRGVDVEPMGTTLKLEKKHPDGSIVRITSSPHDFLVNHSQEMHHPKDPSKTFRQDTLYSPVKKQDGMQFYAWLKENLAEAGKMTMMQLRQKWDQLGINYDYH